MIKVIRGSVENSPENEVIIHQVNCQNAIGYGVAGAIVKKYPFVETQYHQYCDGTFLPVAYPHQPKDLLGNVFMARSKESKRGVLNVFGQLNYGNSSKTGIIYTNEAAIKKALDEIAIHFAGCEITFAIPYYMGCGFAGGNWDNIYQIIKETLVAFDVHIYDKYGKSLNKGENERILEA